MRDPNALQDTRKAAYYTYERADEGDIGPKLWVN